MVDTISAYVMTALQHIQLTGHPQAAADLTN